MYLSDGSMEIRSLAADGTFDPDGFFLTLISGYYSAQIPDLSALVDSQVITVDGYTGSSVYGPLLALRQSRGTPSTPVDTGTGDTLGGMILYGYDSGFAESAVVRAVATENFSVGHGTQVIVEATANGQTSPVTVMTIGASGTADPRVGIGISPIAPLHVLDNNGNGILLERTSATARKWNQLILSTGAWDLYDQTGGADRIVVDTTGKVGIGISTPGHRLDVQGGDVNTSGVFRKGGTPGLTVTRNMVASVNTSATGVFGTPGAGQTNGTVVTGVTLTSTGFSGGIITS